MVVLLYTVTTLIVSQWIFQLKEYILTCKDEIEDGKQMFKIFKYLLDIDGSLEIDFLNTKC